jgi:hypothetical protein
VRLVNLGFALMYRSAATDDDRNRLEDWVSNTPEQLAATEQARRRAAAAALGARVVEP